ncbi:unnamed protein product, partial [Cyprideis torosa]
WRNLAFADVEIPIGNNEKMMHPRVEARMLQELAIQPTDYCLEIGTGSGFYDVIAVTGSIAEYSTAFEERLNIGGRLFIVSGSRPAMHALLVTRESEDEYTRRALFETSLKPLLG